MRNPLRKKLYMLTQEELLEQIKKELTSNSVGFNQDEYGNIWSFNHIDAPAFVSHADTMIKNDLQYKIPVVELDGKLSRDGYILGADDRAGVNLILNHMKRINFIITTDEEIGCVGAKRLSENDNFKKDCDKITWFCELDRRGGNDILGNVHGYCHPELVKDLLEVLPNHKDTRGSITDIDMFTEISQGVNLSIGYYNAHSIKEYLNIEEFLYINSKIIEISKISGNKKTFEKPSYYKSIVQYDTCDFCGKIKKGMSSIGGSLICKDCIDDILGYDSISNLKCSCCGGEILDGESYYDIRSLNIIICEHCGVEKKWRGYESIGY